MGQVRCLQYEGTADTSSLSLVDTFTLVGLRSVLYVPESN